MLGLGNIFGEVIGLFRDHIKGRRDVAVAKAQAEVEIAKRKATAEIDWDQAWAEQAKMSWKDEWFIILHSIPVILCFIQVGSLDGPAVVAAGFQALEQNAPDWFIGFYGAGVAASFGIRSLKDIWLKRPKIKNK